jgi:hypothetical protein
MGRPSKATATALHVRSAFAGRHLRRASLICALALLLVAPAIAAAPPGVPREQLNSVDMGRAESAVLRLSDLGAPFRVDPKAIAEPMIPHCGSYPGDRSGTTVTAEAKSAFAARTPHIGSKTLFFKTPTDLDRYWALTVRTPFVTCEAKAYVLGRARGVKAKTLFASAIPIGATGADHAVAFRTITRLSIAGHPPWSWYRTFVFLSSGRGLTMLKIEEADRACVCSTGLARVLALRLIKAGQG